MQVMAKLLHKAIGLGNTATDEGAYNDYMKHFENSPVSTLRDMLELQARPPLFIVTVMVHNERRHYFGSSPVSRLRDMSELLAPCSAAFFCTS